MQGNGGAAVLKLSGEESLQSIAVELHRANQMKLKELQIQAQQLAALDRISAQLENPQGAEHAARSLEMMERALSPLQDLVSQAPERRPEARVETLPPTQPPDHEVSGPGTRIRQSPPNVRELDGSEVG